MSNFEVIHSAWRAALELEQDAQWWRLLSAGKLKMSHYMGFLRETYHYTRINPQTQAYSTMFYDRNQHRFIGSFLKHAAEEVTHDQLALNDLEFLGADRGKVKSSLPAPMTTAFSGLPFYMLQFGNPLSYLGHIFHLEFIATQNGSGFMKALEGAGIPSSAMTFISDHASIDPKHNQMMTEYIQDLVKTKTDVDAVIYGATVASRAYSKMLDDCCVYGERDFSQFDR